MNRNIMSRTHALHRHNEDRRNGEDIAVGSDRADATSVPRKNTGLATLRKAIRRSVLPPTHTHVERLHDPSLDTLLRIQTSTLSVAGLRSGAEGGRYCCPEDASVAMMMFDSPKMFAYEVPLQSLPVPIAYNSLSAEDNAITLWVWGAN